MSELKQLVEKRRAARRKVLNTFYAHTSLDAFKQAVDEYADACKNQAHFVVNHKVDTTSQEEE